MYNVNVLENDINNMKEKLDKNDEVFNNYRESNNQEHKEILKSMQSLESVMTKFILKVETRFITKEEAKNNFASKLSEKLVYSTAGLILTSVILGLIFLVIKK